MNPRVYWDIINGGEFAMNKIQRGVEFTSRINKKKKEKNMIHILQ